jgi:hypothetical protein
MGMSVLKKAAEIAGGALITLLIFATLTQHVYACVIQQRWGLLAIGLIIPIVGMINAIGIWLGAW